MMGIAEQNSFCWFFTLNLEGTSFSLSFTLTGHTRSGISVFFFFMEIPMTIKVYHSKEARCSYALSNEKAVQKWLRDGYEPVAEIDTNNLEIAWFHTNHIDKPWWEDDKVTLIKQSRSSQVGDLFEHNGDLHRVCSAGFSRINPELLQQVEVHHE
jgi:hypothetical protein